MLKKPLHISAESAARRTTGRARLAGGFSLLEIMIVLAIALILGAIAVPNFLTAYYGMRLKGACSDLSGFMQRTRIQAAKNNAIYTIGYRAVSGVQEAYMDLNLNGQWDANEPLLTFNSAVTPAPGAPDGTGGTPTPYVLVGDTAGVTYDNATLLGYSPRGLPCAYVAATCNTPAAGYFVYYLKDQRPNSIGWGAVIVTRAGRTKTAVWSGTSWQ